MSKDRDYIKGLFDSDGISAPESLSEENMLAMLNAADEKPASAQAEAKEAKADKHFESGRIKASPSFRKLIAVAAVAVIAVFGISGLAEVITSPPDTSEVSGELYTFKSEREIKRLLNDLDKSPRYGLLRNKAAENGMVEEELLDYDTSTADGAASEEASADTGSTAVPNSVETKSSGDSHSETYLQVDDVDEADIVKTDGRYIYFVTDKREVVILSAKNGKTRRLSTIGSNGIENYIEDIYIKGDRLITVGTIYRSDTDEETSGVAVYDISDRSKPKHLYDFGQTGSILTSRMVGDYVYLITNDYVYRGGRSVPMCGTGDSFGNLSASDICCIPEPETTSYIVLSAVDVSSGEQGRSATKAVLGASSEIYCNDHNLYSATEEWSDGDGSTYTRIVRASLDGTKVKFNATARVRGYINSQFSMDERSGYFRIATTSQRVGMDVNNLYVLDEKLKEAGKITGFARNESIKAVRYFGEKAYVITYEAIDPLFIIDLSDPADPRIEGEVKIDGFSTLLIPVGSGRLLGIGHATGDNGYGGEYDSGLKLALFDISDPSEPKVLDSKEFENMSSPAQYDHHALMINSDAGYFAIPYEIWNYSAEDGDEPSGTISSDEIAEDTLAFSEPESSYETGVLLFRADDKIGASDRHPLGQNAISRSVYIGDWIYALDSDGNVQSFKPEFRTDLH